MKKVSIELDDEVWNAIPKVARFVNLVQCNESPETAARLLEYLVRELLVEIEVSAPQSGPDIPDVKAHLEQLLDPNISKPIELREVEQIAAATTGQTLLEYFESLEETPDAWVSRVKAMVDDQDNWKRALAATYAVVQGQERKSHVTWSLIERTYSMLKGSGGLTSNEP